MLNTEAESKYVHVYVIIAGSYEFANQSKNASYLFTRSNWSRFVIIIVCYLGGCGIGVQLYFPLRDVLKDMMPSPLPSIERLASQHNN